MAPTQLASGSTGGEVRSTTRGEFGESPGIRVVLMVLSARDSAAEIALQTLMSSLVKLFQTRGGGRQGVARRLNCQPCLSVQDTHSPRGFPVRVRQRSPDPGPRRLVSALLHFNPDAVSRLVKCAVCNSIKGSWSWPNTCRKASPVVYPVPNFRRGLCFSPPTSKLSR